MSVLWERVQKRVPVERGTQEETPSTRVRGGEKAAGSRETEGSEYEGFETRGHFDFGVEFIEI